MSPSCAGRVPSLAESLDPLADDEVHASWAADEIRRRDEVRSGKVKAIPGDVAAASAYEAGQPFFQLETTAERANAPP